MVFLKELTTGLLLVCESYLEGKTTKRPFNIKRQRSKQYLYFDVCSPLSIQARGLYEYFVIFIDNYLRYSFTYLMV